MKKVNQKILLIVVFLFLNLVAYSRENKPEYFIVDSWLTGFVQGMAKSKEQRWKGAWNRAKIQARNDCRIWGGLFVTDTNLTGGKRFLEFGSRLTYQVPQTAVGFLVSHFYNSVLCKVNTVSFANGSTVLNMNVNWTGICFGNYILAKNKIEAQPNNRIFQHEYGHYLQSKRMGIAYLVRVGLPAIMSKGNHDAHPVEVDCNREAFLYFNKMDSTFQNDSLLYDKFGWNFLYNPFPDSISKEIKYSKFSCNYINYLDTNQIRQLDKVKVRARWFDYAGWIVFPTPILIGMINASKYNKVAVKEEGKN